jgi:hypothetical protein
MEINMKTLMLTAAMLVPLSGFAFAQSSESGRTETNRCNDPNLVLNYQFECVPRDGVSTFSLDETQTFRQQNTAPSVSQRWSNPDFSLGDPSFPTSDTGSDSISSN